MRAWGLDIQCADPAVYSPVLTGVMMPEGIDADAVRKLIYERFDMSLGTGLGKMKGRMFRIGHLGDCNDLMLLATLAGCEMGMRLAGVPLDESGLAGRDGLVERADAKPSGLKGGSVSEAASNNQQAGINEVEFRHEAAHRTRPRTMRWRGGACRLATTKRAISGTPSIHANGERR